MDYMELYQNDSRFERYVNACMSQERKTLVDMLQMRTIQLVGDYYKANPPREEPKVKHDDNNGIGIIECGGC
jgi:hypothetical protein